jgi:phage-related protein
MATWTWPIAAGEALEIEPRVKVARMGDGYEQRVANGIHTMPRRYAVRLAADDATLAAAEGFLRARGGVESFDWTALDGASGRWVCRKWSRSFDAGGGGVLQATFEEVFE